LFIAFFFLPLEKKTDTLCQKLYLLQLSDNPDGVNHICCCLEIWKTTCL